jgi:hypothetical protein
MKPKFSAYVISAISIIVLSVFLYASGPANAIGGYFAGLATDWSDLERQFDDWRFNLKRGLQSAKERTRQEPLWGAFVFCPTGTGTYKWASVYDEQDRGAAIDMARTKLNAQRGRCNGNLNEIIVNQWEQDYAPTPRLSRIVPSPTVQRVIDKQVNERAELERRLESVMENERYLRTVRDRARWEIERDTLRVKLNQLKGR